MPLGRNKNQIIEQVKNVRGAAMMSTWLTVLMAAVFRGKLKGRTVQTTSNDENFGPVARDKRQEEAENAIRQTRPHA
jgi:hypothetical protein